MSATEVSVPRLACAGTQNNRHEPANMTVARCDGDGVVMRCVVCRVEVTRCGPERGPPPTMMYCAYCHKIQDRSNMNKVELRDDSLGYVCERCEPAVS